MKTIKEVQKEVYNLGKKLYKLIILEKIIKKPEIKDKFKKYVDRLYAELEYKEILLQNMKAIKKKKDKIEALENDMEFLTNFTQKNPTTESCIENLQEQLGDRNDELNALEASQFELEIPNKMPELKSLFSKMQEINKQIELFYSTNESKGNSVDVNENSQGFQYFIKNSNTSNDRSLG